MRSYLVGIAGAGVAALTLRCASPLGPGDILQGTWASSSGSGQQTQLMASRLGADVRTPCTTAHFPPLRLDDSLYFRASGVFTAAITIGGSIHAGDPITVSGRMVGSRVVVNGDTLGMGSIPPITCVA